MSDLIVTDAQASVLAAHAIAIQGGYSTPEIERERLLADAARSDDPQRFIDTTVESMRSELGHTGVALPVSNVFEVQETYLDGDAFAEVVERFNLRKGVRLTAQDMLNLVLAVEFSSLRQVDGGDPTCTWVEVTKTTTGGRFGAPFTVIFGVGADQ